MGPNKKKTNAGNVGPRGIFLDRSTREGTQAPSLTPADLQRIDECLLSHTSQQWQKVAKIIGSTMTVLGRQFPDIPEVFYAQRIKHLAAAGAIEAVGGMNRIRHSEVRIADTKS